MTSYQARLDRLEAQLGDDVPKMIVVKVADGATEAEREAATAERRRVHVVELSFVDARL